MAEKKETKKKATKKVIDIPMEDVKPVGEESPTKGVVTLVSAMYKEFIEEGFTREEALELTKTIMGSPALQQPRMSLFG